MPCHTVRAVNSCKCLHSAVYYLKATFGYDVGDAVLGIPVSITGSSMCLTINYQISSPRIELVLYQLHTGKTEYSYVDCLKYTDQRNIGRWNYEDFFVNSDVEAIQLVAKKTGVTTNVEYVLIDVIGIEPCFNLGGNVPFCGLYIAAT